MTPRGALPPVAVPYPDPSSSLQARARVLAGELGLSFVEAPPPSGLYLLLSAERLMLCEAAAHRARPFFVDFASGATAHRARSSGLRQPLARAAGFKKGGRPLAVLDATAGFGRDAFALASLGARVTAIERNPAVFALTRDGFERAAAHPSIASVMEARLRLVHADAREVLLHLPEADRPDAVYIDPMYPAPRKRSALPGREIRLLRRLVGGDADAAALLAAAQKAARERVAVKRPPSAPPLGGKPSLQFTGKLARYDVYLV
ncbi:MAG: class I SAM-dependent methyltransferase [Planctomycetota bacterium]